MVKASKIVNLARDWIGKNEKDGSHKEVIDIYNAKTPRSRGYKVKYTDEWCATFVSVIAILADAAHIMPIECSCGEMVKLYQAIGCWDERDGRVPNPGDIIFYDWQDKGKGDNTGWPDHVGIVDNVVDGFITVIEGNRKDAVGIRTIAVNSKFIRGYGIPRYDAALPVEVYLNVLEKGCKGSEVKAMQLLLIGHGYSCGCYGADGDFGEGTQKAMQKFQKSHDLADDGICDAETWTCLLGR